jgi:hypothetical protein
VFTVLHESNINISIIGGEVGAYLLNARGICRAHLGVYAIKCELAVVFLRRWSGAINTKHGVITSRTGKNKTNESREQFSYAIENRLNSDCNRKSSRGVGKERPKGRLKG